jgi:hypothetical protein
MNLKKLPSILGVFAFFLIIKHFFCVFFKRTETNIISDEGIKILENPDKKQDLRKAVDEYHRTGDWSKTSLKKII